MPYYRDDESKKAIVEGTDPVAENWCREAIHSSTAVTFAPTVINTSDKTGRTTSYNAADQVAAAFTWSFIPMSFVANK
jgi:hypothetical protein